MADLRDARDATLKHIRIEFYRIYRICRKIFLVVFENEEFTKNSIIQILQIL